MSAEVQGRGLDASNHGGSAYEVRRGGREGTGRGLGQMSAGYSLINMLTHSLTHSRVRSLTPDVADAGRGERRHKG